MKAISVWLCVALLVAALGVAFQLFGKANFGFGCGFEEETELLIASSQVLTPQGVRTAASEFIFLESEF